MGCTQTTPHHHHHHDDHQTPNNGISPTTSPPPPECVNIQPSQSPNNNIETGPVVAIIPASSQCGIHALKSLLSSQHRQAGISKIVAGVQSHEAMDRVMVDLVLSSSHTPLMFVKNIDMAIPSTLDMALDKVDRLFVVAPNTANRTQLVCNTLEAAKKAGVKCVVVLSMSQADKEKLAFQREFFKIETRCKELAFDSYTIMRCASFMDNFLGASDYIVSTMKFYGSHGTGKFPAVSVADVGRCVAEALANPKPHAGRVYELTGPDCKAGADYAAIMSRVLGIESIEYVNLDSFPMMEALLGIGMETWQAEGMIEMFNHFAANQAVAEQTDDVAKICHGVHTTFEQFVREHAAEFKGEVGPLFCLLPGTGNIAGNVLSILSKLRGMFRVRVVVKDVRDSRVAGLPSNFSVVKGDFSDPASIDAALVGVSRLLLVAPTIEKRVQYCHQVISAARRAGVHHLVLLSLLGCETESIEIYRQFRGLEKALENLGEGSAWTVVRAAAFSQNLLGQVQGNKLYGALGDGKVSHVDCADLGEAITTVLKEGPALHHGKTYNCTGPQAVSMKECAGILGKVLEHTDMEYVDSVPEVYAKVLAGYGVPEWLLSSTLIDLWTIFRDDKGNIVTGDLATLIGRSPTTLAEFASRERSKFR